MEKPMQDKMERFRTFLANNGFYVVLVVCLLLVGGAITLLAVGTAHEDQAEIQQEENPIVIVGQSNDQKLSEALNAPQATQKPNGQATVSEAQPKPTIVPIAAAEPTEAPPAPTVKPASTTSKAAPPVDGTVIFGFAIDKLLYSVTLDQWTTHPAVDIAADAGTPVKCVFSGTVEKVEKDDALGYTVRVQHSNGRTTVYANLGEDVRVKAGDKVSAGDVLGTVGTSAISECALSPHVHFAILVDGTPKDPSKYVRIGG